LSEVFFCVRRYSHAFSMSSLRSRADSDLFAFIRCNSRGRDGHCCPPPARIPAGGFPAPGSCLRYDVSGIRVAVGVGHRNVARPWPGGGLGHACSWAAPRACSSTRHFPRPGAFPPSAPPQATNSALFADFIGTTHLSDFSSSFIGCFSSSPSSRGPVRRNGRPVKHEISQVPTCSFRA